MSARPFIEIYPESMVSGREPNLLEKAYGVAEKSGEKVRLEAIVPVKEKAIIYTHQWLAPVIYRFDEESGALVILDILKPSPMASYVLESIGGERIRKQANIGILYVSMKPHQLVVSETYSGLAREKLRVGLTLSSLRVQVKDVSKLLLQLWRKHGSLDVDEIVYEVKRFFRKTCEAVMPETSVEDLLARPANIEEKIAKSISTILEPYGLELIDVDVKSLVSDEAYNYYFWHIVNELPVEYTYILQLLPRLPKEVYQYAPTAIEMVVASLIGRRDEKIANILATLLSRQLAEESSREAEGG